MRMLKDMPCCFTGHGDLPSGQYQKIISKTEETIEDYIKKLLSELNLETEMIK